MSDSTANEAPQWDVPGWDWAEGDYTWLSSKSGIYLDGVSVFFIHGGRIRHQAHLPHGSYSPQEFDRLVADRAEGLDDPQVVWSEDTGDGYSGLWVEGTRPPNESDLERLQAARERARHNDEVNYMRIRKRHPDWFTADVELDEFGRPQ